jgi:hypothetical protein
MHMHVYCTQINNQDNARYPAMIAYLINLGNGVVFIAHMHKYITIHDNIIN